MSEAKHEKAAPTTAQPQVAVKNNAKSHLMLLTELLLFSIGLAGCLTMQVDRAQPAPYMDEIFHVPMAQRYCRGEFSHWDPKITTPPGLYLFSAGLLRLLGFAQGWSGDSSVDCSVFYLRLTNLVCFAASFLAIYGILSSRRHYPDGQAMPAPPLRVLKAFCLSLLPVSFFFVSLFYTDQASLACVLGAYLMQLNGHHVKAGVLGCLAMLCRQTNAVWLVFLLGLCLERDWLHRLRGIAKRVRDHQDEDESEAADEVGGLWMDLSGIFGHPREFLVTACSVALRGWPLVAALAAFAILLCVNGGVALGDRAAHEARLHTPQVMYFLTFAVAMHPAALLQHFATWRPPLPLRRDHLPKLAVFASACCLCCLAVKLHTYEHPYLLADNRHLTFYAWQRLFQRHWTVRYLLTPGYVACLGVYWVSVRRSALFRLALLGCTCAALVPAALVEPRYFIVPWTLWRLSASRWDSRAGLLAEIACFASVNAAVYWLFLTRPFYWPSVAEPQRFIW